MRMRMFAIKRKFSFVLFSVLLFFGILVSAFIVVEWFSGIYVVENTEYLDRFSFRSHQPEPYRNSEYFSGEFLSESARAEGIGGFDSEVRTLGDFSGKYINIEGGFRATTDTPARSEKRVHVFGGSTVFSAEVPDEMTIPSYLQRSLNRNTGVLYEVINHGVPSMNSHQQLILLKRADLSPGDVVVFYDGVNDVIYNVFYGYRKGLRRDSPILQKRKNFFGAQVLPFLDSLYLENLSQALKIYSEKSIPENARSEIELLDRAEVASSDRYEILIEATRYAYEKGARFYHFLQPNLFFLDRKSTYIHELKDNYKLINPGMETAFAIAHPLFMDLTKKLRSVGMNTMDLTTVFNGSIGEVYLDFCHTNEVANEKVAEAIFEHVRW